MTGFGAGRGAARGEEIAVEVRSVNHKFCDVKPRMPRELGALETEATRQVRERLHRGAIEVTVRRSAVNGSSLEVRADVALAREYVAALRSVQSALGLAGDVDLRALAELEGVLVVSERPADFEAAQEALAAALGQALAQVESMRDVEGAALARDMGARLDELGAQVKALRALAPDVLTRARERLAVRVQQLTGSIPVEAARIEQEIAVLADRTDISEELARLESHVAQARGLVAGKEPAGRRLDFLVQEMHREANTIGSKAQSAEVTTVVVAMKAEIEKLREQVQNVE